MSDQPTTGEWVCGSCGASANNPDPATSEWTAFCAGLWGIECGETVICEAVLSKSMANQIADAHNAALAAEREDTEKYRSNCLYWKGQSEQLREQLAAEREAARKLCELYFNIASEAIGEEAVRQKRDSVLDALDAQQVHNSAAQTRIDNLEQQLAAERERHDRAQERATKWFDLLSAEREKRNRLIAEWSKDARSAFELRDQLDAERDCSKRFEVQVDDCQQQRAAAVGALKELKLTNQHDAPKGYPCTAYCPACKIDAVLAKIGEKHE